MGQMMPVQMAHGGAVNPGPTMSAAGGNPGDWQCPNTSCKNHFGMVFASKAFCPLCGTGRPGLNNGAGMGPPQGGLIFDGVQWRPMGGPAVGPAQGGFPMQQGGFPMQQGGMPLQQNSFWGDSRDRGQDWPCPNTECMNHTKMVFGTKDSCPRCGAIKPGLEMGGRQAGGRGDKSRGGSKKRKHRRSSSSSGSSSSSRHKAKKKKRKRKRSSSSSRSSSSGKEKLDPAAAKAADEERIARIRAARAKARLAGGSAQGPQDDGTARDAVQKLDNPSEVVEAANSTSQAADISKDPAPELSDGPELID